MRQDQKSFKRGAKYSFFSVLILVLFGAISGAQASNPILSGPESAVNSACTQEAATAGCGTEVAGHGLVRCIHAYKKANPSFNPSPTCHAAIKVFLSDVRAQKSIKGVVSPLTAATIPSVIPSITNQ